MCKNEQTIHYCTILSAGQWDFLLDGKAAINRQKCLHRLMTAAVRTKTVLRIKGVEIALEVGQAAASDVELAEYMGCNRKTIGKLIDNFNRLGMLTTRTNNRTSIHTLHFLTGWYVDGVLLSNPHYVKPAAVSKRQTGGAWTPYSNDMPLEDKPCIVPDGCLCPRQDVDACQTEQPPFLLPFARLWFPTVRRTERIRRTKPTIPISQTMTTGSMKTIPYKTRKKRRTARLAAWMTPT